MEPVEVKGIDLMLEILTLWIESLLFTGIIIAVLQELSALNMARRLVCDFQQIPHFTSSEQARPFSMLPSSEHRHNSFSFERGTH